MTERERIMTLVNGYYSPATPGDWDLRAFSVVFVGVRDADLTVGIVVTRRAALARSRSRPKMVTVPGRERLEPFPLAGLCDAWFR